jgi:hypothetical protein
MPQLRTLMERVDFLVNRDGCMTMESRFTQHCLTFVSAGQLQALEQGAYRALPSPSDQEVQTCILRMSKWADMAQAVEEAEFPDFLLVTDFSLFALGDEEKAVAEVVVNRTHCQMLPKLLSVDAQALACHIARHRPTAQAINKQHATQQSGGLAENSAKEQEVRASVGLMLDSLQLVVMRYLVRSCSTAGVEQRSAF